MTDQTASLDERVHAAARDALAVAAQNPAAGPDAAASLVASAVLAEVHRQPSGQGSAAERAALRDRMADEAQPAETDEQRADREETERDHARGDHTHCGITCETEMPTEHLRNFVIAKGYPGTKGALAELERRAAAGARQDGAQR
ncbi:hypothetical protein ACH49_13580 [Streptomyces leeuwenhoekii]|uniref:Uncharacterized protein n=1 Tax=Streptomyces leeuwenhoekii TaxID=1437453 RepID=A0ABR5HZ87_STRLW|nr:hypothetical protein [Streptomyces leeuwenhoekii]KMS79082.1 hypothetical protein ACH49_13580 [Streptomyces leeuwenhoekii]